MAKLTVTWSGLPPAVSKALLQGRRQPWRCLGFYGSTGGGGAWWGRGLSAEAPPHGSSSLGSCHPGLVDAHPWSHCERTRFQELKPGAELSISVLPCKK